MFAAVFGLIGARIVRLPRTPSNTPVPPTTAIR